MEEEKRILGRKRPRGGKRLARKPEVEQSTPQADIYYTVKSLVGVLIGLVLIFTFLGRIIIVDGISMEPTLQDGELMLVRSIGYKPAEGDIVILAKDGFHNGEAIVKRIIAVGGQTVEIDYATGVVYVDEMPLDEPYIKEWMIQQSFQTIDKVQVPEGCVFVMGDNRNNSDDSRDQALGVVDDRLVIGEAVMVLFPFGRLQIL